MTIRASQVMPVYPLTQDLQPGDVFLVQLPIDKQQTVWNKKGFLPLDNHIARLNPGGYMTFYGHSFPLEESQKLPLLHLTGEAWKSAPRAAFPTYGFSVQRGAGLDLAIPISGVPIGLGLMGSDAAEGIVSIGSARTLGIDVLSLDDQLRAWAATRAGFFAALASQPNQKNYLRIVTRVYLTGELDIGLRDSSQRGAGADAGVPSPIELLIAKTAEDPASTAKTNVENYENALSKLNAMLAKQDRFVEQADGTKKLTAGGSVRFTSATARSITMKETFEPPLVLGYLGFDCEIRPGGVLGPAVSTHTVLDPTLPGAKLLSANVTARPYYDTFELAVYEMVAKQYHPHAKALTGELDALSKRVPSAWDEWTVKPDGLLTQASKARDSLGDLRSKYRAFRQWRASVDTSIKAIESKLATADFKWVKPNNTTVIVNTGDEAHQELERTVVHLRSELSNDNMRAEHDAAMRKTIDWFVGRLYGAE